MKGVFLRQFIFKQDAKKIFWLTVFITSVLKIWIAAFFPITSDEAFFHEWGNHLNYGYYDHPPMIGWWLWLLTRISHEPLVIRSLSILLTTVVALAVVFVAKRALVRTDEKKVWLSAAVYLTLPVSWSAVFVTTDTPLIFFMTLSCVAYVVATRRQSLFGIYLAGLFLGLAFLSKYFAVILGLALGLHAITQQRRWSYLFALLIGVLPFILINVSYNIFNCWNNIMFNLVNRHDDAELNWGSFLGYLGMIVYVLTPWVLYWFMRGFIRIRQQAHSRVLLILVFVPFVFFLLVSLTKTIGLHWVLGFIPLFFVLFAASAGFHQLRQSVYLNCWLSLPHILFFAILMHLPGGQIQLLLTAVGVKAETAKEFHIDVQFHRHMPQILERMQSIMPKDALLTTTSYSPAALMSYHYVDVVPVFGSGKDHARNDDVFVDWTKNDQKTIFIVSKIKPINISDYAHLFESYEMFFLEVRGVPLWVFRGDGFNYEKFRQMYLQEAVERYYQIPEFLPVLGCPFAEKYGFEKACRLGDLGFLKQFN